MTKRNFVASILVGNDLIRKIFWGYYLITKVLLGIDKLTTPIRFSLCQYFFSPLFISFILYMHIRAYIYLYLFFRYSENPLKVCRVSPSFIIAEALPLQGYLVIRHRSRKQKRIELEEIDLTRKNIPERKTEGERNFTKKWIIQNFLIYNILKSSRFKIIIFKTGKILVILWFCYRSFEKKKKKKIKDQAYSWRIYDIPIFFLSIFPSVERISYRRNAKSRDSYDRPRCLQ